MANTGYAVVKNGVVENMILLDGETEFFIEGSELVEATSDARIGGTYDGAFHFVEPTPPEPTRLLVCESEVNDTRSRISGFFFARRTSSTISDGHSHASDLPAGSARR